LVALSAHEIKNTQKGSDVPKAEIKGNCRGSINDRRQLNTKPGSDYLNDGHEIKQQLSTNQQPKQRILKSKQRRGYEKNYQKKGKRSSKNLVYKKAQGKGFEPYRI